MSHHLIDISAPSCTITCKKGQLICRPDNGPERTAPMEDVGAVLINSFSALIHNQVFLEAIRCGTVIILCDRFRPAGLLLPANRSTDTMLTKAQLGLSDPLKRALWHKTVTAKCLNQAAFARAVAPDRPETARLARAAPGPRTDKESTCARLYWAALANRLELDAFRRRRDDGGLNCLLNYGYAVLLARVLQRMLAVGIDPTFGIGHALRERAAPLAYDLMEPFRVAVDARIVAWIEALKTAAGAVPPELAVSQEYKKWILGFLDTRAPYEKKRLKVESIIELTMRGFREAIVAKRPGTYKPWTLGNTKWDGSS